MICHDIIEFHTGVYNVPKLVYVINAMYYIMLFISCTLTFLSTCWAFGSSLISFLPDKTMQVAMDVGKDSSCLLIRS